MAPRARVSAGAADTLRRYFEEVWNGHDLSRFDEFVAEDVRFHRPTGEVLGRDGWRKHAAGFLAAFPRIAFEVEAVVEAGDVAAARIWMSGANEGPLRGAPATGRTMRVAGRPWARVADGRIVEFWSLFDEHGMLTQLGLADEAGRAF